MSAAQHSRMHGHHSDHHVCVVQELIDRLMSDNAISEQDCEWLMYGASQPADADGEADLLGSEIRDLSQQVSCSVHALLVVSSQVLSAQN